MMSFSFSEITRDLRCGPAITRSIASSISSMLMSCRPRRAATTAASFPTLPRSGPAEPGATVAADGVDLVDEDDGRRAALGLLEQVADPGGADADEHLDEVRTRDGEEGHARLTGDRPGEQRLTGAGRAEQQDALGD